MKTFVARTVLLNHDDNSCVGGNESNRHSQGDIFVAAPNKAAAIEKLSDLGYPIRPADVRVGSGNDMDALLDAGVITDGSLILISGNRPLLAAKVSKDESGVRSVVTLGEIKNKPGSYEPVFIPA